MRLRAIAAYSGLISIRIARARGGRRPRPTVPAPAKIKALWPGQRGRIVLAGRAPAGGLVCTRSAGPCDQRRSAVPKHRSACGLRDGSLRVRSPSVPETVFPPPAPTARRTCSRSLGCTARPARAGRSPNGPHLKKWSIFQSVAFGRLEPPNCLNSVRRCSIRSGRRGH